MNEMPRHGLREHGSREHDSCVLSALAGWWGRARYVVGACSLCGQVQRPGKGAHTYLRKVHQWHGRERTAIMLHHTDDEGEEEEQEEEEQQRGEEEQQQNDDGRQFVTT